MSEIRIQKTGEPNVIEASDGRLTLSVPIQIKRRSGRKLVTLPIDPMTGETAKARPWDTATTPLQLALARGHRWLAMLESGEAKSLKEIAVREGIDNSYVSRMVNLTTLAPDIVAAILDDAMPNHVTLFDLAVDPPALWDDQRKRLAPSGSPAAATAFAMLLNRRTRHRGVGAVDAAVSRLGLEHDVALLALIKPLACIGGHRLGLGVSALGTSQRRFGNDSVHLVAAATDDGYPASLVARVRVSVVVFASSKVTLASRLSRFTSVLLTPETLVSAFLTVMGHAAQFMSGTDSVTVCVPAQRGEAIMNSTDSAKSFFIVFPFNRTKARPAGIRAQ